MKNLTLQSVCTVDVDLGPAAAEDDPISHFCLDSTEGLLYAVTRSGVVLCLAQGGKKLLWSNPFFEEWQPPFRPNGAPAELVVSFSFVLELDAVFIACSSGELLLLHTASRSVEEVGVVSDGVAAAGWSPDGELLVLLGYNSGLLMMNKEWDVLAEVTVPGPAAAAGGAGAGSSPVLLSATLTWRGDSKYFATNTLWATTTSSSSSSSSSSACRLLHIWDREDCQLHSTAQAAAGLAAPIAWQPNSRHLYAAAAVEQDAQHQAAAAAGFDGRGQPLKAAPHQQPGVPSWPAVEAAAAAAAGGGSSTPPPLPSQPQQQQASSVTDASGGSWLQHVLLYERNGLQHGGFNVPTYSQASSSSSSGLVIHALHWSSDSELLAVVLAPAGAGQQRAAGAAEDSSGATHEWHVQLWHRSNWHWYLKHEQLSSLPDAAGCLLVTWDEALPGRLHLMAGCGSYSVLDCSGTWPSAAGARRLSLTGTRCSSRRSGMARCRRPCVRCVPCCRGRPMQWHGLTVTWQEIWTRQKKPSSSSSSSAGWG
ncbi:IKI3 family-domain-containing protein [Scenedesmus sp. NREL 46B-D3]|nr:IKI3 family-domain-containing protein [Scenedesmus sp. NREL 46B-D3]